MKGLGIKEAEASLGNEFATVIRIFGAEDRSSLARRPKLIVVKRPNPIGIHWSLDRSSGGEIRIGDKSLPFHDYSDRSCAPP